MPDLRCTVSTDDILEDDPQPGDEVSVPASVFWKAIQQTAIERGDVAGWPIPVKECRMWLADRHPLRDRLNGRTMDDVLALADGKEPPEPAPPVGTEWADIPRVSIRNSWTGECHPKYRLPYQVTLYDEDGRTKALVSPRKHRWVTGIDMLLQTFEVAMGWDLEPEERALEKLRSLVPPHIYKYYLTTGAFMETSPRSQVSYIFRRLKPTVAMRPDPKTGMMRVLATLCLHPLAWYEGTWAGAMVPTDDVLAHLLFMRGDEHYFWRCANQHQPEERESGL